MRHHGLLNNVMGAKSCLREGADKELYLLRCSRGSLSAQGVKQHNIVRGTNPTLRIYMEGQCLLWSSILARAFNQNLLYHLHSTRPSLANSTWIQTGAKDNVRR